MLERLTLSQENPSKSEIQEFWKSLYSSLYESVDPELDRSRLFQAIEDLEDMFRYRDHGAVKDMHLNQLTGLRVLEVGSGAGGHSALFARHGAKVVSVDLTLDRVRSTDLKFRLMENSAKDCLAIQGDAESLAFSDNSFDVVYSNGVLHHTLNTQSAINEVYRVLKPGGRAVIMLYCKSSWHYWINMFLAVGILQGKALTRNWLGRATEWGGKHKQTVFNPVTRCYSRSQLHTMFNAFENVKLRKADFYFYLIPKLGKIYRRYQIKKYGTHPGGLLVYGEPWPIQSRLELRLGRIMGFSWWITGSKAN